MVLHSDLLAKLKKHCQHALVGLTWSCVVALRLRNQFQEHGKVSIALIDTIEQYRPENHLFITTVDINTSKLWTWQELF